MVYQTIQGEDVPALGLGTWRLEGDTCREAVRHALELGYRHVDTAQAYENEAPVGEGWTTSGVDRAELFLTTKVWTTNLAPDDVRHSTEESLRKLQTDYVDLLLVHWPAGDFEMGPTLDAFRTLQDEGKAHHIGVSNFTPELLEEAADHADLFCLQAEYHPLLDQHALIQQCRKRDMLFTAYSPLARGQVFDDELLQTIAEAHDKTPAQVVLRWHVQQKNVAAIPKASAAEHRAANFDIFDFALSEVEMASIFDLARGERLIAPDDLAPDDWNA